MKLRVAWSIGTAGPLALVLGVVVGCGAKTGLRVPDAGVESQPEAACIEVPVGDRLATIDLATAAELHRADVFFLVDHTESMFQEIDAIREQLRERLAPAIFEEIPDTEFGVATFADFPVEPFGVPGDDPFTLRLRMTGDLMRVQNVLDLIELANGLDHWESQVEALYQLATGEGLAPWVAPSAGCPSGGFGAACFRGDALPVVLLFTDAAMHEGPTGARPYTGLGVRPHRYAEAVEALARHDIRVIGLWSGEDGAGRGDLTTLVRDTNAVDAAGEPLVFDIGEDARRLGSGVIDAIKTFADAVVFDIDVVLRDPEPDDGFDPTQLVRDIRPVRAEPMSGVQAIDHPGRRFLGVVSGTRIVYALDLGISEAARGPQPRRYRLEVVFRGNGATFLGSSLLDLVIPADDGRGCDELAE